MSMLEDGAIVSDLLREKGQNSARSRFISDESYFAAASSTHFIAPDKEMDESEESKEPPSRINTCGQAFYTAPADQLDIPDCDDILLYSLSNGFHKKEDSAQRKQANFSLLQHFDYKDLTHHSTQETERMNTDLPNLQVHKKFMNFNNN